MIQCSQNNVVLHSIIRIKWIIILLCINITLYAHTSIPTPDEENIITVIDGVIDEPLEAVTIYNLNQSFSTFTDARGQADITGIALTDTLFFSYISYCELKISVKDIRNSGNKIYMERNAEKLGEVIVYGHTKRMERSDDIPPIVEVIGAEEVAFSNPQTSADMLANTGSVFVQKSQMGGGSPIIRGFEANKLLIVLDGVRMNNAIYRSGHLQNVISIDNAILDKTEIVYGPASVIYGSDALGGVMHFYTQKPQFHAKGDKKWASHVMTRFASANMEKTAHFDVNYGNEKWATLLSASYSDFDDLLAGRVKNQHHPNGYGERHFYAQRIDSQDTVLENDNPFRQIGTGFGRLDLVQKTRFRVRQNIDLMLNLQYSTTTDVPRYDQLTRGDTITLETGEPSYDFKFTEWYYGPQSRLMAALSADIESEENIFDDARLMFAFQKIDEDRITRDYNDIWQNYRQEDVYVYSLNADLSKQIFPHVKILYGGEMTYNKVVSEAHRRNLATGDSSAITTRYPNGGSNMTGFAIYANANAQIKKNINLMSGVRYSYITLGAKFEETELITLPYSNVNFQIPALTGSLGMAWDMGKNYNLHMLIANAFRAPNVDDVGKVRSKNGFVTIPQPNTNPENSIAAEKSLNAEISLAKNFKNDVRISGTYFYTYLFDAIVRQRDTLPNGSPILYYDGNFDTIQSNINAGEAFIYGVSGTLLAQLNEAFQFKASVNYTYGHNISDSRPLAHIPPLYGLVSLDYEKEKSHFQVVARYNGWKHTARYADDSSDNFDRATPEGTPPWYTFNFYASRNLSRYLRLTCGVENILDKHYRPFSSGVSAAGRNFMVGLHGKF